MRPSPEPRAEGGLETGSLDLDLARLSLGEQLLIWALRMRLSRGPSGPVRGFRLAFGLSGIEAALASFEGVFGLLRRHCRCDIGMHAPGCRCVCIDEMVVAGVIAALQAGAPLHAQALALRLVDACVLDGFLAHARDLAASMKRERFCLPVRWPERAATGSSSTVH